MSDFKHIVNVVPMTRTGRGSSQIFTYLVPLKLQDQIRPGQLVKVPFGQRLILGITTTAEMHRLPSEIKGLKSLETLVDATPVLSDKLLALAEWMASYYVCSLGLVVKAMLPPMIQKPREPDLVGYEKFNPDFILTEAQRQALNQISGSLGSTATFLLHGVTGSGKTEIYMQVMERMVGSGKQIIMLVPEISLTDMAIERFAKRFGIERIALLHSRLRNSERYWMWQKIREGERQIIIGPRSAIFAPARDLGLIILDEEHDPSFKQYDQNPKYHTRTVAKKLSELWQCPLILGDATPSVETFHEAAASRTVFLRLPHRIKADVGLPKVHVIDMRQELKAGNSSIFSEFLKLSVLDSLKAQRQIILFLNRRGAASFVMCRDCGYVVLCPDCSAPLVYHLFGQKLLCHHCGKSQPIPDLCPRCGGARIKYFGLGTQTVEEELIKFLKKNLRKEPIPQIERMDRDTVAAYGIGSKIYEDWVSGKTQILIGTQMIGKGWDVHRVGLVGVISADTTLHLPDYRANERTFQLLTQVAGRAGRGTEPGSVILQTHHPENFAVQAAKLHDYGKFYETEIKERQKYRYPPFSQIVKLTIRHKYHERALEKAQTASRTLLQNRPDKVEIIGPVPAFIEKLRGRFQYQVILKLPIDGSINAYDLLKGLPSEVDIDVDPESLL